MVKSITNFTEKVYCIYPKEIANRPKTEFIQWHNENVYKG